MTFTVFVEFSHAGDLDNILEIEADDSIYDVKHKIFELAKEQEDVWQFEVMWVRCELMHCDRVLEDDCTVADSNIQPNDVLRVQFVRR
jgi:hypothetical protein